MEPLPDPCVKYSGYINPRNFAPGFEVVSIFEAILSPILMFHSIPIIFNINRCVSMLQQCTSDWNCGSYAQSGITQLWRTPACQGRHDFEYERH